MKDRIKQIREHFGLSQAHFAQRIHKSPGFISLVESGRSDVSEETIAAICSVLPVNKGKRSIITHQGQKKKHLGQEVQKIR